MDQTTYHNWKVKLSLAPTATLAKWRRGLPSRLLSRVRQIDRIQRALSYSRTNLGRKLIALKTPKTEALKRKRRRAKNGSFIWTLR